MKRSQELTPGAQEQAVVLNLVTKIQSALDNLVVAPSLFDAAVPSLCLFLSSKSFTYIFFARSNATLLLLFLEIIEV